MRNYRPKVGYLVLVAVIALPLGLGLNFAKHQWLLSVELAEGVKVKQRPFENFYDIRTAKGQILENVDGWIIRSTYVYGSLRDSTYFMIDLEDLHVDRFRALGEIDRVLIANRMPVYNMSDEESVADLKYDGGRNRKYAK